MILNLSHLRRNEKMLGELFSYRSYWPLLLHYQVYGFSFEIFIILFSFH